jgi:cation diffusion facilitator CzcD-associated flavoprotein CzcO
LIRSFTLSSSVVDVVILGAGPYGLSIAAHLRKRSISYRIFGRPMQSWQTMMPKGMHLKSEGFASSLYDPDDAFTLADFCAETGRPYADVGIPVPLETFVAYGLEFQKRFAPDLETTDLVSVKSALKGFVLKTEEGEAVLARKVVVAAGIAHFGWLPPVLSDLPREFVTHSSAYGDLSPFKNRSVAVIGAGASAVDIAAILQEEGAHVEIVTRADAIAFHEPAKEPRPWKQRIANPRSGLGIGWRSRLCTDAPLVFHLMPKSFRLPVVRRHLGPAPGWFVRDKIVDRVPMHLGVELERAEVMGGQVHLKIGASGSSKELVVDHVIGGTGYRVSLERLKFLDNGLRRKINTVEDTPVLNSNFESSVPGLFFVGVASANSFGPLTRFAFGAKFTARRLSRYLANS